MGSGCRDLWGAATCGQKWLGGWDSCEAGDCFELQNRSSNDGKGGAATSCHKRAEVWEVGVVIGSCCALTKSGRVYGRRLVVVCCGELQASSGDGGGGG